MSSRSNSITSEESNATSTAEITVPNKYLTGGSNSIANKKPSTTAADEKIADPTGVKESNKGCCSCFSFFTSCFTNPEPASAIEPLLFNKELPGEDYQSVKSSAAALSPATPKPGF
jgi:hypothetical protein